MPNILIAEGTPTLWQTEHAGFAIPSNFSLFATAVQLHDPGIRCTLINIADGGALPFGDLAASVTPSLEAFGGRPSARMGRSRRAGIRNPSQNRSISGTRPQSYRA
jgi:hypothetical protein